MFNRVDKTKLGALPEVLAHMEIDSENTLCYISEHLDLLLTVSRNYGAVLYDKEMSIIGIYTDSLLETISHDVEAYGYDSELDMWQYIGIDAVDYRVL